MSFPILLLKVMNPQHVLNFRNIPPNNSFYCYTNGVSLIQIQSSLTFIMHESVSCVNMRSLPLFVLAHLQASNAAVSLVTRPSVVQLTMIILIKSLDFTERIIHLDWEETPGDL